MNGQEKSIYNKLTLEKLQTEIKDVASRQEHFCNNFDLNW